MSRVCGKHRGKEKSIRVLVKKPEGKRPSGRPRLKWKDNIKMDLHETGWKGVDWFHLA